MDTTIISILRVCIARAATLNSRNQSYHRAGFIVLFGTGRHSIRKATGPDLERGYIKFGNHNLTTKVSKPDCSSSCQSLFLSCSRLNHLNKYGDIERMSLDASKSHDFNGSCQNLNPTSVKAEQAKTSMSKLSNVPLISADGLRGLLPGAPVAGLDRNQFNVVLKLVAMRIPAKQCSEFLNKFDDELFVRPRMKRIFNHNHTTAASDPSTCITGQSVATSESRYMLLSEKYTWDNVRALLSEEKLAYLNANGCTLEPFDLLIDYNSLSVEEVLRQLLPATIEERVWGSSAAETKVRIKATEIPSSYEQVGVLAHMNIREELWSYKYIIGQVMLDKHYPTIKTVVNKTGTIENEFRTFPMEVIAGVESFDVEVRESGAKFKFNFRDVYWNSRLGTEHHRLIEQISSAASLPLQDQYSLNWFGAQTAHHVPPLVVADLMAGVGPFAIPLSLNNNVTIMPSKGKNKQSASTPVTQHRATSRREVRVYANDLNPASHQALVANRGLNHISIGLPDEVSLGHCSGILTAYNTCGRMFIRQLYRDLGAAAGRREIWAGAPTVEHCIMNLPQNATDFLDAFVGIGKLFLTAATTSATEAGVSASQLQDNMALVHAGLPMPRVHVYGFSTDPLDPIADMARRAAATMGCSVRALYGDESTPDLLRAYDRAIENTTHDGHVLTAGGIADSYGKSNERCSGTIVRDVAPTKLMICLSFILPREVAFTADTDLAVLSKRRRED